MKVLFTEHTHRCTQDRVRDRDRDRQRNKDIDQGRRDRKDIIRNRKDSIKWRMRQEKRVKSLKKYSE